MFLYPLVGTPSFGAPNYAPPFPARKCVAPPNNCPPQKGGPFSSSERESIPTSLWAQMGNVSHKGLFPTPFFGTPVTQIFPNPFLRFPPTLEKIPTPSKSSVSFAQWPKKRWVPPIPNPLPTPGSFKTPVSTFSLSGLNLYDIPILY